MTTPDRTTIRNRADYALTPRNTMRPPSPRSLNQVYSQNQFSPLSPSFPPLPSTKLATFSETVSGTSKQNNLASSSKSDTSDKMS